jgi:hypothetical protein
MTKNLENLKMQDLTVIASEHGIIPVDNKTQKQTWIRILVMLKYSGLNKFVQPY